MLSHGKHKAKRRREAIAARLALGLLKGKGNQSQYSYIAPLPFPLRLCRSPVRIGEAIGIFQQTRKVGGYAFFKVHKHNSASRMV